MPVFSEQANSKHIVKNIIKSVQTGEKQLTSFSTTEDANSQYLIPVNCNE
ncbi:MAG: hypothetical protein LBS69_03245 [Prevotellaceae bacterium]|jgi:hypothetical protein|nr:hypothetical protein [Prevotellaceae bacterium]